MIALKDLPPGIRPVRLTEQRVLQLARRSVYFPVGSHSPAARYYKGDVRAAISHGLALECEYAEAQERHQTEVDALHRRITELQAILHRGAGLDHN